MTGLLILVFIKNALAFYTYDYYATYNTEHMQSVYQRWTFL